MSTQKIVFGGGCFWCTEAAFSMLKGVVSVMPGYAGTPRLRSGSTRVPTYEEVCSGETGHAEVVQVTYDPDQITFDDLLTVFFSTHDPTTKDRQGNDVGTQYRSAIYFTTEEQKQSAVAFIHRLETEFDVQPVTTALKPLEIFYPAEEYHREYYKKNPDQGYCQAIINPKIQKLKKKFAELLK